MAASNAMPAGDTSVGLLLNAIQRGDSRETRLLLRDNPALAHAVGPDGVSAVLLAVYNGHPELVPLFVEYGARLSFFESCAAGDRDRALALLEADPSLLRRFAPDGYHGLGLAVFFGHRQLAEDLLSRGADVNTVSANSQKVAALHSAVARSNVAMARMLLARGASPDAPQSGGFTPLHAAAFHGNRELVELLLACGANPARETRDGITAAILAADRGHHDLAAWLAQR
ncbi:MAG: ankyrin repeat domain-containing protein [Bryobacteraceae bacterium]